MGEIIFVLQLKIIVQGKGFKHRKISKIVLKHINIQSALNGLVNKKRKRKLLRIKDMFLRRKKKLPTIITQQKRKNVI